MQEEELQHARRMQSDPRYRKMVQVCLRGRVDVRALRYCCVLLLFVALTLACFCS